MTDPAGLLPKGYEKVEVSDNETEFDCTGFKAILNVHLTKAEYEAGNRLVQLVTQVEDFICCDGFISRTKLAVAEVFGRRTVRDGQAAGKAEGGIKVKTLKERGEAACDSHGGLRRIVVTRANKFLIAQTHLDEEYINDNGLKRRRKITEGTWLVDLGTELKESSSEEMKVSVIKLDQELENVMGTELTDISLENSGVKGSGFNYTVFYQADYEDCDGKCKSAQLRVKGGNFDYEKKQ
ncbi:MAG: hypothetical protein M5U25_20810 [Planctomycetota bacterium]|nr:hypothetical protein [Planctomycetota bacterium]